MALQNRVTPFGEIISVPERGLFMGNRGGRIHNSATKSLLKKRWASKQWICCLTNFKGRQRAVMGSSYTELFFLDEVTALSSGHRPCFECRRRDALAFARGWAKTHRLPMRPRAREMDNILHKERQISGRKPLETVDLKDMPDGVMVAIEGQAMAVMGAFVMHWSAAGYHGKIKRKQADHGQLLTPRSIVEILRYGYRPQWHPSAEALPILS